MRTSERGTLLLECLCVLGLLAALWVAAIPFWVDSTDRQAAREAERVVQFLTALAIQAAAHHYTIAVEVQDHTLRAYRPEHPKDTLRIYTCPACHWQYRGFHAGPLGFSEQGQIRCNGRLTLTIPPHQRQIWINDAGRMRITDPRLDPDPARTLNDSDIFSDA